MSSSLISDGNWIAVQIKVSSARKTEDALRVRGYETFLPLCTAARTESRYITLGRPLLPGYLFCRYVHFPRFPIVTAPGVLRIVGLGKTPIPVPDGDIERIRRVIASQYYTEPWRFLQSGNRVVITQGPLRGIDGIVMGARGAARLVVSVELLQRSIAITISPSDLAVEDVSPSSGEALARPQLHSLSL